MRWDLGIATCCAPGDLLAEGWLAPGSAVSAKGETTSVPPCPDLREPRGRTGTNSSQSQGEPASHHCRVGQGSFLPLSFQQGPSELVFREQGFWGAGKVAPEGGLSRVQDSPPGWPCCRDLVQAKAIGENPSFHLTDMLGALQRAKDPAVCLAPGLEQLLGVTVTGVSGWHWWVPLPSPCCCLGTAELKGTIPMDPVSLSWAQGEPSPQSSVPSLAALELCPSVAAVSLCPWLCQSGGSGAEELLGFGSCQSQVLLTPLCPCWAQGLGTAACPLHVLLSWPSPWAGACAGCGPGQGCPAPAPHWAWWALPIPLLPLEAGR